MKKFILLKTVFNGDNFGSSLQAYALKTYLSNFFNVDCIVVEEVHRDNFLYSIKRKIYNLLKSCLSIRLFKDTFLSHFKSKKARLTYNAKIQENFAVFTTENLTPHYYTYKQLKKLSREEGCIGCVCGSDQIWNPTGTGLNKNNFLRFSPKEKNMSYAASIGSNYIPHYNYLSFKKNLDNISKISVREEQAKYLIEKNFGKEVTVCIDPVILVGREFWNLCKKNITIKDYVFCYFLNKPSDIVIQKIKNNIQNGIEVFVLSRIDFSQYNVKIKQIKSIEPFQFIDYINCASEILTDSFHGTAFSIILQKEFFVFERDYQTSVPQNSRITSLLTRLDVENRFVSGNCDFGNIMPINYTELSKKLDTMIKQSREFIQEAIRK